LIIGRKVKFKKRRLDINRFVNDSLATIKRMIEEKIVISADLHPNLPAIEADEGQLYQVLLNLVINARDVMKSGGKIVISTGLRDVGGLNKIALKAGKYVYLSVRDTGPGIPEHIKDRIFEPFFTTKPKSKGTGLGLSVVYSIVNEHDGFIEVKTELDKGTEFIVLFPAVNADLDHDGETELCLIKEVDGEGKKVLVAEDEEIIRDLLSICLSEWGFEVLMANNGEEALKIFEKMPDEIDIVILDKVMPQISGLDALKRIKTINPDIKSIICTGYTSPEEVEEIEKVGVSSILKKPFKIEQLKEALIKIV
ncbi:MAG: response regulator, partial [Nitrospirae bacterium]|nr:response regulator [Nitrospirota bacterium]